MTLRERWLTCDGYTIELEEGQTIPLQDLHTILGCRQRLPLQLMLLGLASRLAKPSSASSFRCVAFDGERAADADARASRTAAAAAGYRTDAIPGPRAGDGAPAAGRPVPPARPDDSAQVAA